MWHSWKDEKCLWYNLMKRDLNNMGGLYKHLIFKFFSQDEFKMSAA